MNLAPHIVLVFIVGIKRILPDLLVSFMAHSRIMYLSKLFSLDAHPALSIKKSCMFYLALKTSNAL